MADTGELIYEQRHRACFRFKKICFPILVVLCVVLLVIVIVLAGLYSHAASKATFPTVEKPKRKYEICSSDFCFDLGKELVHNMNQSVDPCHDFYTYSCGGWQQRHPVEKDQDRSTIWDQLGVESLNILKSELEQASLNYPTNDAVMKTARFYNACLDTAAIDALGAKPLIKLTHKYGGWSIFNNTDNNVSIETRITRALRELNVGSLMKTYVVTDEYNSSSHILLIAAAQLTFYRKSYFNKTVQESIKKKMDKFVKLLGINGTQEKLMAIYNFEVKLAELASGKTPQEELSEAVEKNIREKKAIEDKRLKLKEFCDSAESCDFLKRILKKIYGQTFTGEELVLGNATYYKQLYKFWTSTAAKNRQVVIDYLMWRVFYTYLTEATSLGKIFDDKNSTLPRWKECIQNQMGSFEMPLGLLYVNKKFDETSKETVEKMTDDITHSFISRLPQETWIDPATRENAKQKALAMRIFIGYPSYIKDPKKLADKFKNLIVTDQYFANHVALNAFIRMRNINEYGKPVDKYSWDGPLAGVNGYYNLLANSITYLAGILQPPFYDRKYPSYMQYGAIGMVIGHELTHGFDSNGRKYDKEGNLHNWWSDSADKNFKEKASCFVDQYSKYRFHGKNINGTQTINENIADNGGIKIAYDAYQRWASRNKTDKILPGLKLTPDQLFFISFGQVWCGVFTDKGAAERLSYDSHSPGKYRVIGTLTNFEKFSEAFQCPVNSPMNPKKKCSVW